MPETTKSLQQKIAEKNAQLIRGEFGQYGYSAYELDGERYIAGITGIRIIQLLKQITASGIIGYPVADWFSQNPLSEENDYKLNLMLAPTEAPPFSKQVTINGKKKTLQPHQVSIPSPVKSWDYSAIRAACGGNNGLMWGDVIARAYVAPKVTSRLSGRSQVVAGGTSEKEALSNLESILTLYDGKVLDKPRISYPRDVEFSLNKHRVYPAWLWIHKPSLLETDAKKLEKIKIMIFYKQEPESFKKQLAAIL